MQVKYFEKTFWLISMFIKLVHGNYLCSLFPELLFHFVRLNKPGTVTTYLHALKKFAHFLTLYDDHAKALSVKSAVLHNTILMAE